MIEEFLSPVNLPDILDPDSLTPSHFGKCIEIAYDEIEHIDQYHIAIIGVCEERGAVNNSGCAKAPDVVRKQLYRLHALGKKLRIIDLGNIIPGASLSDTYFALSTVVNELIQKRVVPLIIGGSHDLTFAQYHAYEKLDQVINMVVVDEKVNLIDKKGKMDATSFLYKILTQQPNFVFNFSLLGYQSYFVDEKTIDTFQKLSFECVRLGKVRQNMEEVEPMVRDADMLSFDISAIKQSEAPGNKNASPNGFYSEEACQIVRYAGLSDKLSSIGFYEFNPSSDRNDQTSILIAQMIWYFIEGYASRKGDAPLVNDREYIKYTVNFRDNSHELIFWKSKKSERWWMQVPFDLEQKYERHQLVPCSYADYQLALKEELPERWLRAFEKYA